MRHQQHSLSKFQLLLLLIVVVVATLAAIMIRSGEGFETLPTPGPDTVTASQIENSTAYVIALSNDLYEEALKRLQNTGIKRIERFDAVKGSSLHHYITETKNVTIKGRYDVVLAKNRHAHSDLGTINGIGCYLSHVTLWKKLLEGKEPFMIIFESDALCAKNLVEPIRAFLRTDNPDLLLLGSFSGIDLGGTIKKVTNRFYGLHSYVITRSGAETFLKYAFPIEEQVDSYMSDVMLLSMFPESGFSRPINVYLTQMCVQYNVHGTSIQNKKIVCDGAIQQAPAVTVGTSPL